MLFFHRLGPYSTHGSRINRTFMEATWSYDLRVRCLCPCTKIARKMDRKLIRYQTDGFPDPLSAIYFTNVCSLFEEKIVRHIAGWMSSISKVEFCSVQAFSILLAKIVHTSLSSLPLFVNWNCIDFILYWNISSLFFILRFVQIRK